jgi:hypothetical protein
LVLRDRATDITGIGPGKFINLLAQHPMGTGFLLALVLSSSGCVDRK